MKKNGTMIIIMLTCAALFTGCGKDKSMNQDYKNITTDDAVKYMENEDGYIILDVRTVDEYHSGHIKGAICVPVETIPEEAIANDSIPELPDKDQPILVYCRSGLRSKQAAEKLVKLGYTNIIEFGGILDWKGELEK